MSFRRQLVPTQNATHPVSLPSFSCMQDVSFSLTLCNTSPFATRSVEHIFSTLLEQHISKLSRRFSSTFRSVRVSAPQKPMIQTQHFTSYSPNLSSVSSWKESYSSLMLLFPWKFQNYCHLASYFILCKYLKYSTITFRFCKFVVISVPMVRVLLKQPTGFVVLLI
jgi:hypothetical protein